MLPLAGAGQRIYVIEGANSFEKGLGNEVLRIEEKVCS